MQQFLSIKFVLVQSIKQYLIISPDYPELRKVLRFLFFQDLSEDASPQIMSDRKWSLTHGKFKILTQHDAVDLEDSSDFKVNLDSYPIPKVFNNFI